MKQWALLCSGQGGQDAKMFALSAPYTSSLLQQWWQGMPVLDLPTLLADPHLPFLNRYAQPLVVAASLCNWLALQQCLKTVANLAAPSVVAGYSIGELTACAVAEMLSPAACLQLAGQRAASMDQCTVASPHTMAAITLPQVMSASALLEGLNTVEVAIYNGECNWVIAGEAEAMIAAKARVLALGGSWQELAVTVGSHTPLMAGARPAFAQAMQAQTWEPARYPLMAGVSAQLQTSVVSVQTALQQQLTTSIQWAQCMDSMLERGIEVVLELGPGAGLSRMLQARHTAQAQSAHLSVRAIGQFRSMPAVAAWLHREIEG
ncbi:MAG: acyltransferase domain-containing protein [Burkholderiales bacterium]|nr:acyltransferase domain-containing protein [Burkholderiales bacterium]